jgi:hypothetical protein
MKKIIENSGLGQTTKQQLEAVMALADNILEELSTKPETAEEELTRKLEEARRKDEKYNRKSCNNC